MGTLRHAVSICFSGLLLNCASSCVAGDFAANGIPGIQIPVLEESKVVPIVTIIPGKLDVDLFAIDSILDKIGDRPFAVYSINGPSRTGKSYLLSRFVHHLTGGSPETNNGFEWRGETDRCTRGINVWADPLEVSLRNGSTLPVLLVDTQGCFDEKSPLELDAKLFAIATLLSSVQVFNTIRTIDEATLQFLEAFTGVASMCNSYVAHEQKDNVPDFQKLMVLIRDFQFRDYKFGYYDNNHKPLGENRNFKVDRLSPKESQSEAHQRVRLNIIQSFNETAVYLMPHPGKELSMYDNPSNLDEDFKKSEEELVSILFSSKNLIPKKVGQKVVTGLEFKGHVARWAEVLEKIQNLKLPKTSEGAAEIQYLTGIESARNDYSSKMNSFMATKKFRIDSKLLETKHIEIIDSLCEAFEHKLLFRKHHQNSIRFRKELEEWSSGQLSKYHEFNLNNYEYWAYFAIAAWKLVYPYLLYILATLVFIKSVRWLIGI